MSNDAEIIHPEVFKRVLADATPEPKKIEKSGGGSDNGGMDNDLEKRVTSLEANQGKIIDKLDSIGNDVTFLRNKIEPMPDAFAMGQIKGSVDKMPTTFQMVSWIIGTGLVIIGMMAKGFGWL